MPSTSSVDLVGWKEICVRFYLHGDETARDALSAFERGQAEPHAAAGLEENRGQSAYAAAELLASVGLANLATLDADTLSACIASKNAARRESHAVMEKERRARFDAILSKSMAPENSPPSLASAASSAAMLTALSNFRHTYASDPAVQPFLNGLVALLRKQHKSPTVWRWIVVSEAFTERAYPTFMEDAVVLLCGYFRYVPSTPSKIVGEGATPPGIRSTSSNGTPSASSTIVAEPGAAAPPPAGVSAAKVPAGAHGWDVEPSLSDKQLTRMLDALQPKTMRKTNTHAGMTGKLVDTGTVRANQDGALDDAEDLACPACVVH